MERHLALWKDRDFGPLAQLVSQQLTHNQQVAGSSPAGTIRAHHIKQEVRTWGCYQQVQLLLKVLVLKAVFSGVLLSRYSSVGQST